jgi:general secretion pathway protein I
MRTSSPRQDGFTLLEVIVAFAISALAISILYEGTLGGLAATAAAGKTMEALSLAQSHIAAIGRGAPIVPQDDSGTDGGGFDWTLHIKPIGSREMTLSDSDRANDTKETAAVLYDVVVTESWTEGLRHREVRIATRRFDFRAAAS